MRVKALIPIFYDHVQHEVDEEFEMGDDLHAQVLMASGRVAKVENVNETVSPPKRGRYKHRAMRAES